MARPLLIGSDENAKIAELVAFAKANPLDVVRLMEMDPEDVRDMMALHHIELPIGFNVTYSQEIQLGELLCHHISVSVEGAADRTASPQAVSMIMTHFGMQPLDSQTSQVWLEEIGEGHKAVNVVQPV